MIAWKPKPFIFIHIPKCAGTSIEQALLPHAVSRNSFHELTGEERRRHWLPGRQKRQHKKLFHLAKHFDIDDYFKFSIVRNPWARAVSQIEYLQQHNATRMFSNNDFKANIWNYCTATKTIWGQDLGSCQVDFLRDKSGSMRMDFIGRYESLQEDFHKICTAIGVEIQPPLPHVFNSKRARHYSTYYDQESARWIRERFAPDIETFGYELETQPVKPEADATHTQTETPD